MRIGVIGAGKIGGGIGVLLAQAGHEVLFASRRPETLGLLKQRAGARASVGTTAEAAAFGEAIVFAPYFWTIEEALAPVGSSLHGKLILDAVNPYILDSNGAIQVASTAPFASAGEKLAALAPQARIVKAYNTLPTATIDNDHHRADPIAAMVCGADADIAQAADLIAATGFAPVSIGPLNRCALQEPNGPLYNRIWTKREAEAARDSAIASLGDR